MTISAGAEECFSSKNTHEISCNKENLYKVKNIIEQKVSNFIFTGIEWVALNKVEIRKDKIQTTEVFLETLKNDDDVQNMII